MEFDVSLQWNTPKEWVETVLSDFPSFLRDHADCERKASSMAMSFVAKCPDRHEILPELIETALEELVHFKLVYEVMAERNISLDHEIKQDHYIKQLIDICRSGKEDRLLDRMVVASVVEARGTERFKMVAEALKDKKLKSFYEMLWVSEAKHVDVFLKLASHYWPKEIIEKRLSFFLEQEANICSKLPYRATVH